MARPDQILRMKKLNVQPSFLMNHVRFYGFAYRDQIFGPERAAFMDPAGACVESRLALHAAHRWALLTARAARTHQHGGYAPLHHRQFSQLPDQAISLDDAIRAVTIDAARQLCRATGSGRWKRARKRISRFRKTIRTR